MMTEQQIKAQLDGKFFRFNDDGEVTVQAVQKGREPQYKPKFLTTQEYIERREAIARRAKELAAVSQSTPMTINRVMTAVAAATDIHWDLIKSDKRQPKYARARFMVCWLARKYAKRTLPQIAMALHRDHSTVLYAVQEVDRRRRDFEPELCQAMKLLGVQE